MTDPSTVSDVEFLEMVLRHGPATTNEILALSFRHRTCGLTVHSRAADLRRKLLGERLTVTCEPCGRNARTRRVEWRYRLEPLVVAVVIEAGGQVALAV